ncbi:MAG: sensor domain-containing diguanylate cyclase [Sandaracinaceae bacterium]
MTSDEAALTDQLRIACAVTRMPAGVLFRFSGNQARRVAVFGPTAWTADVPLEAPAWRLAREEMVAVPIVGRGPAAPEIALFPPVVRVTAAVSVPLMQEGRQLGALVLVDREPREDLEQLDLDALSLIARQAVGVLSPSPSIRVPRERTLPPQVHDLAAWPLAHGAHDTVTGLPDRRMLEEPVELAIDDAERAGTGVAVAILALDGFARVDDWLGRDVGDELLRQVAERLLDTTAESDLVGRGSGDQFVAVLTGRPRGASALGLADRMLQAVREPFHVQGYELTLSASVGVARYPEDATDGVSLLRYAGIALHRAKGCGAAGRSSSDFTEDLRAQVERRGEPRAPPAPRARGRGALPPTTANRRSTSRRADRRSRGADPLAARRRSREPGSSSRWPRSRS